MKEYKNRYGDKFIFTEDDNHDILWEGNFEWCRFGMPNDYTEAYKTYCEDVGNLLTMEEFKIDVHIRKLREKIGDDFFKTIKGEYILGEKYIHLVSCLENEIDMVDPSGGPYISRGMSMSSFGFKDYIVKDFERIDTGYKIITEKCPMCNQASGHKMSCSTQKIQINL